VKRCQFAAVLLLLLTSCSRTPPAYESHYVEPTTTTPPAVSAEAATLPQPPQASFVDNFDRPDTALGLGEGWDLRGPFNKTPPQPPATDGFIKDNHYTYAGNSVVYAVRQFRGTVQSIGTVARFRKTGAGSETTLSMGMVPNAELNTDMVHFAARRTDWVLEVRRANGLFRLVAKGQFSPTLDLDRDYQFELGATDNTLTVRVPGQEVTRNLSTKGLLGDRAFWQEYTARRPVGVVVDFDTVWAVEKDQPLFPVFG
jgi:hypothetical protein